MLIFRILARLLSYPDQDLMDNLDEVRELIGKSDELKRATRKQLLGLVDNLQSEGLNRAEADYVAIFDRGSAHSLYLFEHIHGESRFRGMAMVDLAQTYEAAGFIPAEGELPDYLPMFLEYLSCIEAPDARSLLGDALHITEAIGGRLARQESPYAAIFVALKELARPGRRAPEERPPITSNEKNPEDLEALDAIWAEPEAFGTTPTGADACGTCGPGTARPQVQKNGVET